MKTGFWLAPIFLSATLILPACQDTPNTGNSPTSEPRADATKKMSDGDLEKAIRDKLQSDEQIRQANLSVNAEVKENKATIKGSVPSQDVRTKAIELAKSVQPGLTINDEIEVKPAG
ncbi:MAG: BON domain-containing protein [Candidatus Binatia bacterium]